MHGPVFLLSTFLLLSSIAFAEDLSVIIFTPPDGVYPGEVANCPSSAQTGNPTRITSRFTITNPWPFSMSVWYDYFDFGTGAWVEGTHPICNVPPGVPESNCEVSTPLALGGRGSDTLVRVPYIRLKGTDPDGHQPTRTKTLLYTIAHFESETETNTNVKIATLTGLIGTLSTKTGTCYRDFCCGASGAVLDAARTALANAQSSLKSCDLSAAYNGAANAINDLNAASVPSDPACISAVAAANSAASSISAVKDKLAASSNCDTSSTSAKLATAETSLAGAAAKLTSNDFVQASTLATSAGSSASEADAAITCVPSGSGTTPPVTAPPATTTPPASQQPAGPAESSGSLCPLGLSVFLASFLLAAWRQKVR